MTPTHWKSGQPMFVLRKATAGETYPAGRFLIGGDATNDAILLDMNRAFIRCGFKHLTSCPLPLPGNILPFCIEARELVA